MIISEKMKMADVIHLNYLLVSVINRFGIRLGFGDKTVEEICTINNVNIKFFLEITNAFHDKQYFPDKQLQTFSLKLIVEYLNKTHKYYLEKKIPEIDNLIKQIVVKYIDINKDLILIENFFNQYLKELTIHIKLEEEVVYPYVLKIEEAFGKNHCSGELYEQINKYSINDYKREHDDVKEKLLDLKNIIIKYLPAPYDDNNYNNILFELFKLEEDLNNHSSIEEKVLIPKVCSMEEKLVLLYNKK